MCGKRSVGKKPIRSALKTSPPRPSPASEYLVARKQTTMCCSQQTQFEPKGRPTDQKLQHPFLMKLGVMIPPVPPEGYKTT
jgi:hypothetical protein